jgi:hypothetical protein
VFAVLPQELAPLLRDVLVGRNTGAPLYAELLSLTSIVSKTARVVLADFEDLVGRDTPKRDPPADGTVHPLCASTLSYLKVRHRPSACYVRWDQSV